MPTDFLVALEKALAQISSEETGAMLSAKNEYDLNYRRGRVVMVYNLLDAVRVSLANRRDDERAGV